MGRHSAPETEGPEDASADVVVDDRPSGRHAAIEDEAAVRPPRRRGTSADLRLLRSSGGLRAQATVAVLAPFLVYAVIMSVLGHTDRFLVFLWAPIIATGFLFGAVLDVGYRRGGSA